MSNNRKMFDLVEIKNKKVQKIKENHNNLLITNCTFIITNANSFQNAVVCEKPEVFFLILAIFL
jgi:hypothetical protein